MHSILQKNREMAEKKVTINKYIRPILTALTGFFFAEINCLSNMSPFAVAFVSGVSFENCFASFVGSAVGLFVSHSWENALRYLFALAFVCAFRLFILKKFQTEDKPSVCAMISFCAIFSSKIAQMAFVGFDFYALLKVLGEAALCALSVPLYVKAINVPIFSLGIKQLGAQDSFCIMYFVCTFFMSMSGFTVGEIAPARIIAAVVVIFVSHYKGVSFGSVAGICAGFSFCIGQGNAYLLALFAFGGFVSGLFSSLGQYTTALSFALTASCVVIFNGFELSHIYPLAEAIVAAGAYALIPSSVIISFQDKIKNSGLIAESEINRQVCVNLNEASKKVEEVSDIVSRVSEKLDKVINPEINSIFSKMQQNLCCGCSRKSECWNKYFSETAFDIMAIAGIQKSPYEVTPTEKRCIRPTALVQEIDKHYPEFVRAVAAKIKVSEMRDIVSEQFSSVSLFLSEVAQNIAKSAVVDTAKSRTVKTAFMDSGIYVDAVKYFTNKSGRVSVEATVLEKNAEFDREKMKKILEFTTSRRFEIPEIVIADFSTSIIFEEKASFNIVFGQAQIPFAKNKVCGDSIGYTKDTDSNEIAFISDGMGTGSRAAIDAAMTCALLEKLLSCGFSFESAIKTVNSALIIKSTDESLATVDAISINVYSGKAQFFKAGASISFIRRENKVTVVEEASMPLGIIRNISCAKKVKHLMGGDIVLIVSDGVTAGDCGWINDELLAWSTNNMNDLALHIASLAKLRSDERTADDITVLAAKIKLL